MKNSDLIITLFFKNMFENKDVVYQGKTFLLRKTDGLRRYDVGNLLFIEQNPKKESEWAVRARKGAKILWVIDTKWNKYLVRVEDGKIIRLKNEPRME